MSSFRGAFEALPGAPHGALFSQRQRMTVPTFAPSPAHPGLPGEIQRQGAGKQWALLPWEGSAYRGHIRASRKSRLCCTEVFWWRWGGICSQRAVSSYKYQMGLGSSLSLGGFLFRKRVEPLTTSRSVPTTEMPCVSVPVFPVGQLFSWLRRLS